MRNVRKGISCEGVIYGVLSRYPNEKFKLPEIRSLVTEVAQGWNYKTIRNCCAEMTNEDAHKFPYMKRYDEGVYGFVPPKTDLFSVAEKSVKEIHIHIKL